MAQYDGGQFVSGTAINVDNKYYYLHDRIGSVRQVVDKDAAVKWLYTYEPFGKIKCSDPCKAPYRKSADD